jgi:hypothetical protein
MNGSQDPQDDEFGLAQFDEEFAAAPVEDREFDEVPDAKYPVNVDAVEITDSKTSGKRMLKWTFRIFGPRFAGRLLWKYSMLATPENIRWFKNELHVCGLDLVRLSDLPQHLHLLLDLHLEVTKRTKGDASNIYINRRLEKDAPEGGDDFGRTGADHVPF